MNIFQIDREILNCIDTETGEILDEERLESLEIARDIKIENTALWYKNLKAEAGALREEAQALTKRANSAENLMNSLEKYLKYALGGEKFKTSKVNIRYKKSTSVEVENIEKLDKKFLIYPNPMPDKMYIKRVINSGEKVNGAKLVTKQNMIVG